MTQRVVRAVILTRNGKQAVVQRFPVTKENNGLVISTGETINLLEVDDDEYRQALRIGIEQLLKEGKLNLNTITWKD